MSTAERLEATFLHPADAQRAEALLQVQPAEGTKIRITFAQLSGDSGSTLGEASEFFQRLPPLTRSLFTKQEYHSNPNLQSSGSEILLGREAGFKNTGLSLLINYTPI